MKKLISFLCSICIMTLCFAGFSSAQSNAVITVGSVNASNGDTVSVPISISGNPGIEGMTLKVEYDDGLTLKKATKGSALNGLALTPSGNTSTYPFVLLWDGMSDDNSNGVIATIDFEVSDNASGTKSIRVTADKGAIYNDNFDDVAVEFVNGAINITGGGQSGQPTATSTPIVTNAPVTAGFGVEVGSATCYSNETVTVPISVINNPGLAGIQLFIEYDKALSLTSVKKGEALSSFEFTPSGTLSLYPFSIIWDGIEEDSSNGTVAYITFKVPSVSEKTEYAIKIYSNKGGIYDGDLNDVTTSFVNGTVTVIPTVAPTATPTATPTVAPTAMPTATPSIVPTTSPTDEPTAPPIENHKIELDEILFEYQPNAIKVESNIFNRTSGDRHIEVLIAVYTENRLLAVRKIDTQINAQGEANISELFENVDKADVIKVFAWDSVLNMIPVADLQIKNIKE